MSVQRRVDTTIPVVVVGNIPADHLIQDCKHVLVILEPFQDRVTPVGRDEPVVRIVHVERSGQATNHVMGTIWPALVFFFKSISVCLRYETLCSTLTIVVNARSLLLFRQVFALEISSPLTMVSSTLCPN